MAHHQMDEKKEKNDNDGFVDLLMKEFQKSIQYTLDVIEKIVNSGLNGNAVDREKEFYLYGAQLIEKWSQTYYPQVSLTPIFQLCCHDCNHTFLKRCCCYLINGID